MGNPCFLIKHNICEQDHKNAIKQCDQTTRCIDDEIIMIAYETRIELLTNLDTVASFDENLQ